MTSTRRRAGIAALLLTVAVGTAGCGKHVSTDDLEEQVSTGLEHQTGVTIDKMDCPDELPAEDGAEVDCTMTAEGETHTVRVTAESVDGDRVNMTFEVTE